MGGRGIPANGFVRSGAGVSVGDTTLDYKYDGRKVNFI